MPTPPLLRRVRFEIRPWGDGPDPARELLPHVDGVSLVELVSAFERAAGYDVPGAYAGLVLDHVNVGDLVVMWSGFVQPHRPERDYGDFGPFVFGRSQYGAAVREVAAETRAS
ncbi:hypothetical protein ACGFI9_10555 [Micromonospora sp. NPDC048930]|uniref:hypothetical protein n=1 Tax=Micromonospora sp. NPDC048930 TaxID=3364261 RepID=UPI00371A4835